jgi:uncharacterized protein YndB with AHSA1/START domain
MNRITQDKAMKDVTIARVFDAPRELVWKVANDPDLIPQWWGPGRLTTTVDKMDVKPGGVWRYVQRASDGSEYAFNGVYREVVPPERLVYTSEFEGMPGHVALQTVTFEEHGGRTKMTQKILFRTVEDLEGMVNSGMEEGAVESMDRFAQLLENVLRGVAAVDGAQGATGREITMSRVFDAPRELVFRAWTDPELVEQWWGPDGFTNTIDEMDVRPGGTWRFVMHGPDGVDYQNRIVYDEVLRPERIVYTHLSGPRFQSTATFEEQGGKTKLTVWMRFESTEDFDRAVREFHAREGLNQTLGRLEKHLSMTRS